MLRTSAAMLRSPSSLIHLSRRIRLHSLAFPDPRLPRPALPTHSRLFSSSSPSGGDERASHDPVTDSFGSLAAASSASDAETSPDSDSWGVFDPVAGRIVMQGQPLSPNPDGEEAKKVAVKGKAGSRGGKEEGRWSAVAAARKASGKAAKARVSYVCNNCGEVTSQWWGICCHCKATGTLTKYVPVPDSDNDTEESHHAYRSWIPQKSKEMVPQSLRDVTKGFDQAEWRIPLPGNFGLEIMRVLGGGIVPGSLVLVGGDPGVGKSSLMLQLASIISEGSEDNESSTVVYVSGEESIEQIGNRAARMSIRSKNLYLYSSTDIEDILDKIQPLSPRALIIDSIQTVYLKAFAGSAGNQMQVKECTSSLLGFAKLTNIPVFLIGHVTKTGDIAGPRVLEHIVDVVLYMEGERCLSHRLLRSVKNRFGSADEGKLVIRLYGHLQSGDVSLSLRVPRRKKRELAEREEEKRACLILPYLHEEYGLQAVLNPSEMFLTEHDSDSEILAGLAVAVILDGSRAFAVEIQALCVSGSRTGQVVGIPSSRADVIISVLMKQAGLKLQDNAIFLNVVGGFKLTETAGDLAIAASICSSFLEFPIPNDIAFIGEIGLGGELRTVPRMDKRVIAIAKLGYRKCIVPKTSEKLLKPLNLDIEILPCSNLKEVIHTVFRPQD